MISARQARDNDLGLFRGVLFAGLAAVPLYAGLAALVLWAEGVSPQRLATTGLQLVLAAGAVLLGAAIVRAERGRR